MRTRSGGKGRPGHSLVGGLVADELPPLELGQVAAGDPTCPIVERLASAAFAAIDNGRRLVVDVHAVRADWEGRLRLRRDATAWRALDVFIRHPVVDARLFARELGVAPQNAYRALEPLAAAGVIVEFTDKKRNRLWRAPDVLTALDSFATRAGRRNRASRR